MKKWILPAGGKSVEAIKVIEQPMPEPGANEVRVKVHAVSLNFRDQALVNGLFGPASSDFVPISDGAGVIDKVGSGVTTWKAGDKVAAMYYGNWFDGPPKLGMGWGLGSPGENGMLSEYVILPANRVVRTPHPYDFGQSACLPCAALTAWNAVNGSRPVQKGEKVLILGTGGVSLIAAHFINSMGGELYAGTRDSDKNKNIMAMNVKEIFKVQSDTQWGAPIFDKTGGVDRVINTIGTGVLNDCMRALRPGGEVTAIGMFDNGGTPDIALLAGKALTIRGLTVGNVQMFNEMVRFIEDHQISMPIFKRFDISKIKEAFEAQSSKELFGKVIVDFKE